MKIKALVLDVKDGGTEFVVGDKLIISITREIKVERVVDMTAEEFRRADEAMRQFRARLS
jgi:hypothetical protein